MDNKCEETEGAFYNFLSHFKVIDRSLPYTHVTMDPPGKYYIGGDDLNEFFIFYQNMVRKNIPVCIAEKPASVSSLRADFDFKTHRDGGLQRQYTTSMIKTIVVAHDPAGNENSRRSETKRRVLAHLRKGFFSVRKERKNRVYQT